MSTPSRVALYSAVDGVITHYDVNVDAATLTAKGKTRLPAKVQYAWPHTSPHTLYVTTSSAGPRIPSEHNYVSALAIGADGALAPHGDSATLPCRGVHMCLHPSGRYVLNGHNFPASGIIVHRVAPDGALGPAIEQSASLNYGTYPHQVMVFPSGRTALIVDRGNNPQQGRPEQPGALRTFRLDDGKLSAGQVVAPGGGYGFGPRHVVFHPSMPWLYVSDERSNRLYMFRLNGDYIEAEPAYTLSTLAEPDHVRPRQMAGAIHLHPDGRTLYVANRADYALAHGNATVFGGGENSIAVYALNPATGEPTLVQHAQLHAFHARTFACEPGGRLLVAGTIKAHAVLEHGEVKPVPAALSVFRIGADGRLAFVRKYHVDTTDGALQYWIGIVAAA